ncbi:MAG: hypothetical protein M1480_17435 [Bacteroidetes bacterium]|nr:hypothetical protein [Bacteroidota bacterium]
MSSKNRVIAVLFFLSAIFIFQSCATVPTNLSLAKEEVINYYESGKYEKELDKVVNKAIDEFRDIPVTDSSAVVFDIDETTLSNYEINKKLDFGYVPGLWDKWIEEAKAPAITGVKRLYDFLYEKGFKLIFITGRKEYQYNSTFKNLVNDGYKDFDTLIVRNSDENNLTAKEYKSKIRVELTQKGYKIAGDVGDQHSDLDGPDHGIQVKIPNYMYIIK